MPQAMDEDSGRDLVLVGVFGAPHGVRGELRLKSFTQDPSAVGDYGPVQAEDGRRFTVTVVRALKDDMVVARVDGVADREAAAGLTHCASSCRATGCQRPRRTSSIRPISWG